MNYETEMFNIVITLLTVSVLASVIYIESNKPDSLCPSYERAYGFYIERRMGFDPFYIGVDEEYMSTISGGRRFYYGYKLLDTCKFDLKTYKGNTRWIIQ